MIGKTLSHYKVIEKIGQGGMGEVYRAEDTNLSREVAQVIAPDSLSPRAFRGTLGGVLTWRELGGLCL